MASRPVYPPSGGQETPRSEVDLDLGLQLQELEINNLKNTVAMHVEATEDLRDTIDIQKVAIADHREGSKDLRDVIKDLRERNDDLQQRNSDLSAKNAAHVDQRDKLQETKTELAELSDNYNRDENLIEELKAKVKQQDGVINGLKRQNDAVDSKQRFTIVELTVAIKAKDEAFQKLKGEHEELHLTYTTKTREQNETINDLSASCRAMEEELEELKELKDEYEGFQDIDIAELHENYVAINGLPEVYEARETELRELRDQLEELRDRCKADHELITDLTHETGQHDEIIATLNAKVKEQHDAIAMSQQQVQAQVDANTELAKQLTDAKKSDGVDADSIEVNQEFLRQLEEKDTEIEKLQEQVLGSASDKTARKLARKLIIKHKKRGEALKEVKRQAKAKDDHIKGLEGQVSNLENLVHGLDSTIHYLEGEFCANLH
ncbi:hypothetical protein J4E89_010018 [Alternaria sp. Ai002NY15]|nr:hypothetical protein J4E89_010018 [Alternaria sp. Ai002NY15]